MAGASLRCAGTTLDLSAPLVMGVLNVTPDSFFDGGRFVDPERAVEHAQGMVEAGAALIDVGGESTRPGADPVSVAEELDRVIPVVERLAGDARVVISVDTSKPEIIRAAVAAGAGLINDVRALLVPGALEAVAASGCAVCLMHMRGEPAGMQQSPSYGDVVGEVQGFLGERVAAARAAGIPTERIAIDPGFGFGKTLAHNLELLRGLPRLAGTGLPLLVGFSRKSSVGALTGRAPGERLPGSLALATLAVFLGAHIVRAHDVAATLDAIRVAAAVRQGQAPHRGG
ncbi:MAG TPA: dihydropteroate synthase [Steroidobacteraceae bacterium]|nr:dihydropteroate synthase [Steroidobacteraceae bacterium]